MPENEYLIENLQNELRKTGNEKEWLYSIIKSLPVGLFLADKNGRIFFTNDFVRLIWGDAVPHVSRLHDYYNYKGWWVTSGEQVSAEDWALARAITKGEVSIGEKIDIERFDGKFASILNSASPVKNRKGEIVGAVVINQNITEQRRMETELIGHKRTLEQLIEQRTSELNNINNQLSKAINKVSVILESMNDAFFALDNGWHITYVNQQAEAYFKIDREKVIGKNFWDIYPDYIDTELYTLLYRTMNEKIIVEFEKKFMDEGFWAEVKAFPNDIGIAIQIRDITNKKKVEDELRKSNERFSKYFHNSPDILSLSDIRTGKYREVNQAFLKCFGYQREEVIGRTAEELVYTPGVQEKMNKLLEKAEEINNIEVEFQTKEGRLVQLLKSVENIEIDGEPYFLSALRDITELKRIEIEMAKYERLNLIAQMAGGIGHEVRNPLTTVRGFLQILADKDKYNEDKEYFDIMIGEIDRANTIISEFLSMAKSKTDNFKKGNINNIVKTMYPLLNADALRQNKNLSIETNKIPDVEIVEEEIRQMLLNLVRNGLEAMKTGGTVTIKTFSDGDYITLAIQDEGDGIPKEIIDKIGTPFFTTKEKGTGLGLSICYRIAQRHNASIDIDSNSQGTVFTIKFKVKH